METEEIVKANEMGDQQPKKVKDKDTITSSNGSQDVSSLHEEGDDVDDSLLDDGKDDNAMNDNHDDEELLQDSDLNTTNSSLNKTVPSSTDQEQGKSSVSATSSVTASAGSRQKSTPKGAKSSSHQTVTKSETTDSAENDESIVVQVNDTLLNEIDSDLLETGDGKSTGQGHTDSSTKEMSSSSSKNTDIKAKDSKQATANKEVKDGKTSAKSAAKPAKKDDKTSRNLWVSGLSSNTRATDLKTLFSKHGKVIGAKVVTNARSPGSRCYGFVTMGTADEATKCIQHLHRTELHGRMVSVERAKTEPQGAKLAAKVLPPSASASRSITQSSRKVTTNKTETKSPIIKTGETKEGETVKEPKADKDVKEKTAQESPKKSEDGNRRVSRERPVRPDRGRREMDTLSLNKIKAARQRAQLRKKEIFLRHEERRRKMTLERDRYKQQMREKRQREERVQLERERRRLREMKEELERERMETERLKLETERLRIQKEQENYRREQQRVLETRRPVKRPIERESRAEAWSGNKRQATERFPQEERHPVRSERKPAERYERREPERPARFENHREERGVARHQERYEERDRSGHEVVQREYSRRDEHRPVYREERTREQRPQRDERVVVRDPARVPARATARVPARHDQRSEWKSERETSRGGNSSVWNGPADHKVQAGGWTQSSSSASSMRQTGGWSSGGVVMSNSGSNYTMQPGAMINTTMGPTPVFIAQPAMQGTPVIMQSSLRRQGDSSYGMATGTIRRY